MSARQQGVDFINPIIRGLPVMGEMRTDQFRHRLHWNENPHDVPAELKTEVLRRLAQRQWSHYTEIRPYALQQPLAAYAGVDENQIVITPGSSELLRLIVSCILRQGDQMVYASPSFLQYKRLGRVLGATVHEVPTVADDNFALDPDAVIESARANKARLVIICAPNNPTGTVHSTETLRTIAAECDALLLIDEAYCQFCGQDLRPLVAEFDHVVLARTFSKAFAMAGVRCGYAVANAALITEFQKMVTAFPLNILSETAALVALENPHYITDYTQRLVAERERLAEALDMLPDTHVYPSGTNFLLVKPSVPVKELVAHLRDEESMLISDLAAYPELRGHIRVSVGAPAQNDLLVESWRGFLDTRV